MLKSVLGEIAKMLESGLFGFLYRVTDVIYKLAWSNILWFFTAGFPLVFLFTGDWLLLTLMLLLISPPGTAALFHVMWVWQEDGDISIWKEYWSGLRKNWKQAYIVINPYIFIGIVLVVDLIVVANVEQSPLKWIGFLVLPLFTLYMLTSVTLLSLLVRYQWKLSDLVKKAFFMSVSHLFSSVTILIFLVTVILSAFWVMPLLVFFFFASLTVWVFTWQTGRILNKIKHLGIHSK